MDELLGGQSAFDEAKALYRMIGDEHAVEELRELIAVPPRIESALRAYAQAYPEESYFVNRTLKFRVAVLEEFERMVLAGLQVDLPEVEETESEPFIEAVAFAQA